MKTLFLLVLMVLPFLAKSQLGLTEQEIRDKYSYATFKTDYVSGNGFLKYSSDIPDGSKYISSKNITSKTDMTYYFNKNGICKVSCMTIYDSPNQLIDDFNNHYKIISSTEWIVPYFDKGTEHLKLEYFMGLYLFYSYYN